MGEVQWWHVPAIPRIISQGAPQAWRQESHCAAQRCDSAAQWRLSSLATCLIDDILLGFAIMQVEDW